MSELYGAVLEQPIDVARYLRMCPSTAETQGTFFQHVRDAVEKQLGTVPAELMRDLPARHWLAFRRYPLREFMQLTVNAAALLHPALPTAEAIRRVGRIAYPSFAATMAGRVVLFRRYISPGRDRGRKRFVWICAEDQGDHARSSLRRRPTASRSGSGRTGSSRRGSR